MKNFLSLALSAVLALAPLPALAQAQVTQINPNDLFQDVVNGNATPQNYYAPGSLLAATFGIGSPSRGNAIIGGDPETNLFQRSTAGTATTSATPAYDGPDRFAQWSASSAGMTVSRSTTAGDIQTGYPVLIKMAHTNTTAGQICIGQAVESANSYQFQGATAELDFHAVTGAGYTGGATLTAYIYTGTVADEGISAMAGGTWTGQATATAAVIPLTAVSSSGRFSAVATIASGIKEIGIALCYTATTADTNDYVSFAGIQLIRNTANAAFVNTGVGYNATTTKNFTAAGFDRRLQGVETMLQQRYYWAWAETASATTASPFMCSAQSSTVAVCKTILPAQLRAAPTVACTAGTLKRMVAGTDTTVSACAAAATTNGVSDVNSVNITATVASGDTAGFSGSLMSGNSTGGGLITASAEL